MTKQAGGTMMMILLSSKSLAHKYGTISRGWQSLLLCELLDLESLCTVVP